MNEMVDVQDAKDDHLVTLRVKDKVYRVMLPKDAEKYDDDAYYGLNLVSVGHYE